MTYFKDPFENINRLINQINEPFKQIERLNKQIMQPAFLIQNQMTYIANPILDQHNNLLAQQDHIFNFLASKPLENLHPSYQSLFPIIEQLNNSLTFNTFNNIDFSFLESFDIDSKLFNNSVLSDELKLAIEQEVSYQIEHQNNGHTQQQQKSLEEFFKKLPLHVAFIVINILFNIMFGQVQDTLLEKPQNYFTEFLEDNLNTDFTRESIAMIRKDTYLRAGKSKQSPLVLQEKLVTAQFVLKHTRQKSWVKISVEIDGETYTGWIEKSNLIKP